MHNECRSQLSTTGSLASTVGTINPFRYRGYVYDDESGLYYLQSRYYNPEWCRFINADATLNPGTGLAGINMFAYCNNNPIMYSDPCGTCIHTWFVFGLIECTNCRNARTGGGGSSIQKFVISSSYIGPTKAIVGTGSALILGATAVAALGAAAATGGSAAISAAGIKTAAAPAAKKGVDYLYQVTSKAKSVEIIKTNKLVPSSVERSVCALKFQPTLAQARNIGAQSYETVIRFSTNVTTFARDNTVPYDGAVRNLRDGVIKIFDAVEVGFK